MRPMTIKTLSAEPIFEGYASTSRELLENAVYDGVDLSLADLSNLNLIEANLDNGSFSGASFAGSNLMGANMSECLLNDCDFQNAKLNDACLAHSNLELSDFDGTMLSSSTIITGTDLSSCYFNCSSVFSLKLREAQTTDKAVYSHLDLIDCPISHPPIVVCGLPHTLVFMDEHIKINSDVRLIKDWLKICPQEFEARYGSIVKDLIFNHQFTAIIIQE